MTAEPVRALTEGAAVVRRLAARAALVARRRAAHGTDMCGARKRDAVNAGRSARTTRSSSGRCRESNVASRSLERNVQLTQLARVHYSAARKANALTR